MLSSQLRSLRLYHVLRKSQHVSHNSKMFAVSFLLMVKAYILLLAQQCLPATHSSATTDVATISASQITIDVLLLALILPKHGRDALHAAGLPPDLLCLCLGLCLRCSLSGQLLRVHLPKVRRHNRRQNLTDSPVHSLSKANKATAAVLAMIKIVPTEASDSIR